MKNLNNKFLIYIKNFTKALLFYSKNQKLVLQRKRLFKNYYIICIESRQMRK